MLFFLGFHRAKVHLTQMEEQDLDHERGNCICGMGAPWRLSGSLLTASRSALFMVLRTDPRLVRHQWESDQVWERMNRTGIEGAKTSSMYRWRRCQLAPGNSGFGESGPEVLAEKWLPGGKPAEAEEGAPCLVSFLGAEGEGEEEGDFEGKHGSGPPSLKYQVPESVLKFCSLHEQTLK